MKRYAITAVLIVAGALFGSIPGHAQTAEPMPATPGCPHNDLRAAVCYDLQLYYFAVKSNLYNAAKMVPDDKFFVSAPGITATRGESMSIGAELGHAAETQSRMCTLIGYHNPNFEWEAQWDKDPGKITGTAKLTGRADVMATLKRSFDECDPWFANLTEADLGKIITGNHGPKPLATTLFNVISHNREVFGRIMSFMAAEGLKGPAETQALTPTEKAIEDKAAAAARANGAAGAPANQ